MFLFALELTRSSIEIEIEIVLLYLVIRIISVRAIHLFKPDESYSFLLLPMLLQYIFTAGHWGTHYISVSL